MMNGGEAGMGVIVGAAVGSGTFTGVAGVEQEVKNTASRQRLGRRRCILFKRKVEAVRQRIHRVD